MLVTADFSDGRLLIWIIERTTVPTIIATTLTSPLSVFVTDDDEIFVDSGQPDSRIERWSLKNHSFLSSISVDGLCTDLFVGDDDVYCSQMTRHQVVKYSRRRPSAPPTIVAGNGSAGSTSFMLKQPRGIFVTRNNDLYVADSGNDRIQMFRFGDRNGTTVACASANGTISLSRPTDVMMDGDGHLFIADSYSHRIVRSDANGCRCVVGCSGWRGSAANQLDQPHTLSFDGRGNLYVLDHSNNRIQRFALDSNGCSKCETYHCSLERKEIEQISNDMSTFHGESFSLIQVRQITRHKSVETSSFCA